MKKGIFIGICLLGFLFTTCLAVPGEHALAVTILKADLANRTVVVRKLDGTEQKWRFARNTPVTSIAEAALNQRLAGGEGYQFVIRFIVERGEALITAFNYVGKEPWKVMVGTLVKSEQDAKTIVVKNREGAEGVLEVGRPCFVEKGKEAIAFGQWSSEDTPEGFEWIVWYLEMKGKKVAHLLEPSEKEQ